MPHVSSRKVNQKTLKQLYEALFKTATSHHISRRDHRSFFNELLTPTEKIMMGKRIGATILLHKGASPYRTGKALNLSPTTTAKLLERLEKGECRYIIKLWNLEQKGPLTHYLDELLRPLPRYGTSPATLFKNRLRDK